MYCMLRWSFQDPETFPPLKKLANQFDNLWYRVWNPVDKTFDILLKISNSSKGWVAGWMATLSNIPLNLLFWFPTTFNTGLLSPQMHLLVSQLKVSEVLHRIWMKNFNNIFAILYFMAEQNTIHWFWLQDVGHFVLYGRTKYIEVECRVQVTL